MPDMCDSCSELMPGPGSEGSGFAWLLTVSSTTDNNQKSMCRNFIVFILTACASQKMNFFKGTFSDQCVCEIELGPD